MWKLKAIKTMISLNKSIDKTLDIISYNTSLKKVEVLTKMILWDVAKMDHIFLDSQYEHEKCFSLHAQIMK